MHVERRVHGRAEEVVGVARDRKMACGVHAQKPVAETTLQFVLEGQHARARRARGHVEQIRGCEPRARRPYGCVARGGAYAEVAHYAVRVVAQLAGGGGRASLGGPDGA